MGLAERAKYVRSGRLSRARIWPSSGYSAGAAGLACFAIISDGGDPVTLTGLTVAEYPILSATARQVEQ